jgi:hypothetical protein
MKIILCKNKFEVIVESLTPDEADTLMAEFANWVEDKTLPSDEDYMAALGPCGK